VSALVEGRSPRRSSARSRNPLRQQPPLPLQEEEQEVGMGLSPAVRKFLDGLALIIARDLLRGHPQPSQPADPCPLPRRS
jgi:hypothetical protein